MPLLVFCDENFWQNYPTTRYRYDGQMTLEEDVTYTTGENIKVDETRYTLGVRGIESMVAERVSGDSEPPVTTGVENRSFPLYDGHGNMIATLSRNGTGYTLGAAGVGGLVQNIGFRNMLLGEAFEQGDWALDAMLSFAGGIFGDGLTGVLSE